MKTSCLRLLLLALLSFGALPPAANGAPNTYSWNSGLSGLSGPWTTPNNWIPPGPPGFPVPGPGLPSDIVDFSGPGFNSCDLNGASAFNFTIDQLIFAGGAGDAYFLVDSSNSGPPGGWNPITVATSITKNGGSRAVFHATSITTPLLTVNAGDLVIAYTNDFMATRVEIYGPGILCAGTPSPASGTVSASSALCSAGTGNWNVFAGGLLKINGSIGGNVCLFGTGSSLNPGCSVDTAVINGGVSYCPGTTAEFELSTAGVAGGGFNDLFIVNGDLEINCTVNIMALPGFGPGKYELWQYTGTLTGTPSLGTAPGGFNYQFTTEQGQVNLIVCPCPTNPPNLIVNGSFETGPIIDPDLDGCEQLLPANNTSMPGWTAITDEIGRCHNGNIAGITASAGTNLLDLAGYNNAPPLGGVTQTVLTTSNGQCYRLSFDLGVNPSDPGLTGPIQVKATASPTSAGSTSMVFTHNPSAGSGTVWSNYGFSFIATGPTTITIEEVSLPPGNVFIGLDNVSLVCSCDCTNPLCEVAIDCRDLHDIRTNLSLCATCVVVNFPTPPATGTCPPVTVVCSPPSSHCFPPGVTTVTCTATDAQGNTASCTFTVTVTPSPDTTPPVIDCACLEGLAQDLLVTTNCPAFIPDLCQFTNCFSDNCCLGASACSQSPPAGTLVGPGTHPIIITLTDCAGNTNTNVCVLNFVVVGDCPTNCCDGCVEPFPASFTITVNPGFNYLVNPLCRGSVNTAATILDNMPDGTQLHIWDKATASFTVDTYFAALPGWLSNPNQPLEPGVGFVLNNPGPAFPLTFVGCEPDCPPRCPKTNEICLVGNTGSAPGTSTLETLFGSNCPPVCGSTIKIFNPASGLYDEYVYLGAGWSPSTPSWPNGTSVFVSWQAANCCTNVTVLDLFSGRNTSGLLLNGAFDPQFLTAGAPLFATANPYVMDAGAQNPLWLAGGPNSQWVGPDPSGTTDLPEGIYVYTNRFFLCSTNRAMITGRWTVDDAGSIWLNGAATGNDVPGVPFTGAFALWYPVNIGSGFVPGWNTLTFYVTNGAGGASPTGLRTELTGTACCQPCLDIRCPPDITAYTCGGPVPVCYTMPMATSTCATVPSVTCVPPSGSLFPPGVTTVYCTATDGQGHAVGCKFTVTVLPERPENCFHLSVGITGTNLLLSWAAHAAGSALEATANPGSSAAWSPVNAPVSVDNGRYVVMLPATGPTRFFRLSAPAAPPAPAGNWSTCNTASPLAGRFEHTAVWTGTEWIIWGGNTGGPGGGTVVNDGARYNPVTGWTPMSTVNAPSARSRHVAVWTGTEMIIWGGYDGGIGLLNDGRRYTPGPGGGTWTTMSTANAPTARHHASAVWSGTEMIVWGGRDGSGNANTGGRYTPGPGGGSWTTLPIPPLAPRLYHGAVWATTTGEMLIWGGFNALNVAYGDGASYNPGGNSWTLISAANAPSARYHFPSVWTGTEMIVWAGSGPGVGNTGARYTPSSSGGSWTTMTTVSAPPGRSIHTGVWTGSQMFTWGGTDGANYDTGGCYDPVANAWMPLTTSGAPSARYNHSAVWDGNQNQMLLWGGRNGPTAALSTIADNKVWCLRKCP